MKRQKSDHKKAVLEKVSQLFYQADEAYSTDPALSDRYVEIARKLAQRVRTPLPAALKKRFCRHCGAFWVPGKSVRVRLQERKVVYYCLRCKKYTRHPYVREQKAKRAAKK